MIVVVCPGTPCPKCGPVTVYADEFKMVKGVRTPCGGCCPKCKERIRWNPQEVYLKEKGVVLVKADTIINPTHN